MRHPLTGIGRDVTRALHVWARRPLIALACVLTLALGIGMTTLMFTGIRGLLLRPLPYLDAERLTDVDRLLGGDSYWASSYPEWLEWRDGTSSFEGLGAWFKRGYTLESNGRAERLGAVRVSGELFDVIGVAPLFGRTIQPADEPLAAPRVVVLAHARWRALGGDPEIVGTDLLLDGVPHEVVGVMPERFWFPDDERDLYVNLRLDPAQAPADARFLQVVGRLAPGVDSAAASDELARLAGTAGDAAGVNVRPLVDAFTPDELRRSLEALGGAALILLLLCSANVANLLLALGTERSREFSLRAALGASPARLARQVLVEALLLALPGVALGVLGCAWGIELIDAHWVPDDFVLMRNVFLDAPVLIFAAVVALLTAVVAGAAPAWRAARADVVRALQETDVRGGGGRPQRLRDALVLVQVATALVLLVGAALMTRTSWALTGADLGFDLDHIASATITLTGAAYPEDDDVRAYFDEARRRVAALPDVEAASVVVARPMTGSWSIRSLTVEDDPRTHGVPELSAMLQVVGPDYLRATGTALLAGREFAGSDGPDGAPVCLISRALAESLIFSEPLGARLRFAANSSEERSWTVVGVVDEVRHNNPRSEPWPTVYCPVAQALESSMSVVARTKRAPERLLEPLRATLAGIDPGQPPFDVETLAQGRDDQMGGELVTTRLFSLFGVLALLLAVVGVYGVTAYNVAHRTRELGVRLALGARPGDVVRLVLVRSLALGVTGLALGLAGAWLLAGTLRSLLFRVHPGDPLTYAGVALLLLAATLVAAWLPARRASRMQPMDALRSE